MTPNVTRFWCDDWQPSFPGDPATGGASEPDSIQPPHHPSPLAALLHPLTRLRKNQ